MSLKEIRILVDENTEKKARKVFNRLGLDFNEAVNLLLEQSVRKHEISFSIENRSTNNEGRKLTGLDILFDALKECENEEDEVSVDNMLPDCSIKRLIRSNIIDTTDSETIEKDDFKKVLEVLAHTDFGLAKENGVYRAYIIGQFNITFNMAQKVIKGILKIQNTVIHCTEVLRLGKEAGLMDSYDTWLKASERCNFGDHVTKKAETIKTIQMIKNELIGAFKGLAERI